MASRPITTARLVMISLSELSGTFLLTIVGLSNASAGPVINGVALAVLGYAFASSAKLNPAVSVAVALSAHTGPTHWGAIVCELGSQFAGAILGVLFLQASSPSTLPDWACSTVSVSLYGTIAWEFIATVMLILGVFAANLNEALVQWGPAIVGLSLTAGSAAASPYTGGSCNPARVFATSSVLACPQGFRYITGYLCGQLLAAVVVPGGLWVTSFLNSAEVSLPPSTPGKNGVRYTRSFAQPN
jgi:glycerol uptake facilitator-like aquaporin